MSRILKVASAVETIARGLSRGTGAAARTVIEVGAALERPVSPDEAGLPPTAVLFRRGADAVHQLMTHGGEAVQGYAEAAEPFRHRAGDPDRAESAQPDSVDTENSPPSASPPTSPYPRRYADVDGDL